MTEDDDGLGSGNLGGVFETSENVDIGKVARNPDAEDIANLLVENDLGRDSRIHATDNGGEGRLLRRGFVHLPHQVAIDRVAACEPFIARFEQGNRIAGRHHFLPLPRKNGA